MSKRRLRGPTSPPAGGRIVYEICKFNSRTKGFADRERYGFTDNQEFGNTWAYSIPGAVPVRRMAVRLGKFWYILASVKPITISQGHNESRMDSFDPQI